MAGIFFNLKVLFIRLIEEGKIKIGSRGDSEIRFI